MKLKIFWWAVKEYLRERLAGELVQYDFRYIRELFKEGAGIK